MKTVSRKTATELRFFFWILSITLPAAALLFAPIRWPAAIFLFVWIVAVAFKIRGELLRHVRTLSNLVESTRMQDYSMRGATAREPGELAELYQQVNSLNESLKNSRRGEQELLSILERVVGEINVAIIVFDAEDKIRHLNPLAAALLKSPRDLLLGKTRAETILNTLPIAPEPQVIDFRFPGAPAGGRWQIREHNYRHQGRASRILFIADLQQVLSDEEIAAWQRLIRVISHEVNNSLTPINSLCQTLSEMRARSPAAEDEDLRQGLQAIADRARGLQTFISDYARLARLPAPNKALFSVRSLPPKLSAIFAGRPLELAPFPETMIYGDEVHLEQALINLIKNAFEAGHDGPVSVRCVERDGHCAFEVADRGPGIQNPDNLFVPFYTTKPTGAGVGLLLCRQIAKTHHGHVSLENRTDGPGAVAQLILPLPPQKKVSG